MEELRGHHGTWRIDDEMVRVRFGPGRKVPALFKALGSCSVPLAAVREVEFDPGDRKHGWRMRLRLAEGMDPYLVPGVSASDPSMPLVLEGPRDKELLAEYFADHIADRARYAREVGADAPDPREVAMGLVARVPFQARTGEGSASFDGERVRLQWDGWVASTAKERENNREYRLAEIECARWHPPVDLNGGYLRIVLRGVTIPEATELDNDFFTLTSHGTKGSEETLLMAATVNAHLTPSSAGPQEGGPAALASGEGSRDADGPGETGADADGIFAKIRELGRLHEEGLLTEEEFNAKKTELLARL